MASPSTSFRDAVTDIFDGDISFPQEVPPANNVTGAIANPSNFKAFGTHFIARLGRLNLRFPKGNPARTPLLTQVKLIETTEWPGAYAELVAYDFYSQESAGNESHLKLNVDLPNGATYAAQFGKTGPANLDIEFPFYGIYSDVKSFKDVVRELLEGIVTEASKKAGVSPRMTGLQRALDREFADVQINRPALVAELAAALVGKPPGFKSKVLPDIAYKFSWKPGVLISESSYGSYRHAAAFAPRIFSYASKFVLQSPFILTMVHFPWFNGIVRGFAGHNETFYRATARRVFLEYQHKPDKLNSLLPSFSGDDTIFEVSKKLAAIVFLEDDCIADHPLQANCVAGYCYINPRGEFRARIGLFEDHMFSWAGLMKEDYHDDDY